MRRHSSITNLKVGEIRTKPVRHGSYLNGRLELVETHAIDGDPFVEPLVVVDIVHVIKLNRWLIGLVQGLFDLREGLLEQRQLMRLDQLDLENFSQRFDSPNNQYRSPSTFGGCILTPFVCGNLMNGQATSFNDFDIFHLNAATR